MNASEQMEKYSFLKESEYFTMINIEDEYERRIKYLYEKEENNKLLQAIITIPVKEGKQYDWEFTRFRILGEMVIPEFSAKALSETPEWLQKIAKPVDNLVRIRKLMR